MSHYIHFRAALKQHTRFSSLGELGGPAAGACRWFGLFSSHVAICACVFFANLNSKGSA